MSDQMRVGSRGTGLRELSAMWRNRVKHVGKGQLGVSYTWSSAIRQCADELDSALSALPLEEGLRAWVRHKGSCELCVCQTCRHNKYSHDAILDRRGPCDDEACGCSSFCPGECSCGLDAAL